MERIFKTNSALKVFLLIFSLVFISFFIGNINLVRGQSQSTQESNTLSNNPITLVIPSENMDIRGSDSVYEPIRYLDYLATAQEYSVVAPNDRWDWYEYFSPYKLLFSDYKSKNYLWTVSCLPYEAPVGGETCEECNDDPFRTCSEYRCKSLGQACEIVNQGTIEEKCIWVNPTDVVPPVISVWNEILTEGHSYSPHGTLPPDLGARVVRDGSSDGCLEAFTPLEFGVELDEPAQCKIDYQHTNTFEEMIRYFSENNFFSYTHSQILSIPSPDSINSAGNSSQTLEIQNDGVYDLYVRCRDRNGNENVAEFAFNFCVDPSPDTTPPQIREFSIESGSYVSFGTETLEISAFVNEPSECRWTTNQDKSYETMENEMSCVTNLEEVTQQTYTCTTTLTGIEDMSDNKFYFRCKDQPNSDEIERNTMAQGEELIIIGSQALTILSYSPSGNEIVTGSSSGVEVIFEIETSNGAEEGKSTCSIKNSLITGSYIEMVETDDYKHSQSLELGAGDHTYDIRCVDAGGNLAEEQTSFSVFVDQNPPQITSAYHDGDFLKVVTNEDAKCKYSKNNCNFNFNDGIPMMPDNTGRDHYASWEPNDVYYIKCKDDFGNLPSPDACSLTASATSID